MERKAKFLTFVLGTVLLLGIPPALMLTPTDTNDSSPTVDRAEDPMMEILEARSQVVRLYDEWMDRYEAAGGDRNVKVGLGYAKGLSTEFQTVEGLARMDLLDGQVEVEVPDLADVAEVWLVDNQSGLGKSVLPEEGDHMVRLGLLDRNGRLKASLGDDFFQGFELDLVVVSRAGETPAESRLLIGSRSYFQRLYTQTRVASQVQQPKTALGKLLSLGSMLAPREAEADSSSVLVAHGLVTQQVADGADLFFRGTFSGNGRTCATCHPVTKNQEIGPEFIATLPASDKLFVAEHSASEGGVPGLEVPALMRQHGLILENVDGAENPTVKFTMRGVPHSLSMSTSITADDPNTAPVQHTGWSGDGAPGDGSLRMFSTGATFQHFTKSLDRIENVDFVFPTDSELDAMEAFMLSAGRTNDLDLSSVTLNDTGASGGLTVFLNQGKCNGCHGNAGAISPFSGTNANFNTGVEAFPDPSQKTHPHPPDGGFGVTPAVDTDGDGVPDKFGNDEFNTTPLVEAADTGPFFHNNAVDGPIEDAVDFYNSTAFNNSPAGQLVGGVSLTPTEVAQVGAFLRVVNAAFNLDQAIQRVSAASQLENNSGGGFQTQSVPETDDVSGKRATVDTLLALANIENADAVEVLNGAALHGSAVSSIQSAISDIQAAILSNKSKERKRLMDRAALSLHSAKADFGSGLNFVIGEGNLLF